MLSVWTKHLKNTDEQERFKNSLFGSRQTLERLDAILGEASDAVESKELSPAIYSTPNWDYLTAHRNGYKECLRTVRQLINLDQKD